MLSFEPTVVLGQNCDAYRRGEILRRDLKARDPERESIGDVSARLGFW